MVITFTVPVVVRFVVAPIPLRLRFCSAINLFYVVDVAFFVTYISYVLTR